MFEFRISLNERTLTVHTLDGQLVADVRRPKPLIDKLLLTDSGAYRMPTYIGVCVPAEALEILHDALTLTTFGRTVV